MPPFGTTDEIPRCTYMFIPMSPNGTIFMYSGVGGMDAGRGNVWALVGLHYHIQCTPDIVATFIVAIRI